MEGTNAIPKWYTPFRLKESWVGPINPMVGLEGLNIESETVDRAVWELLSLKSTVNKDATTPNYQLNPTIPIKKQRRDGLELSNHVPEGLIPSNWADKHRGQVPAVLVAFFKDDEGKGSINKRLEQLKDECAPHGTQLLVMLINGQELSTDYASVLCAAADIPPKSLYILVTSHPDRVHSSVHRLESGIREAIKNYYGARIRRLKGNKERTTQAALHVRYNFKLGFFHEIRKDYVSAMSTYEMATDGLIRLGTNLQEVKMIASVLIYRMCRLHLIKREWNEAKIHFQRHIKTFLKAEACPELCFEHLAYLEQQYHNFGELAKQHYRPDSNNALDPVNFFIISAKYAQQRAIYTQQKLLANGPLSPPTDEINFTWKAKFLGQRLWRIDEEKEKIPLLQYFESISPHSEHVINHLGLASEFCKDIGRVRTRCQMMSMMGEEFLRSKEYSRCTLLMGHVLREFGGEKWGQLLLHVAQVGLEAATTIPDIPAYLNFVVLLLKRDFRPLLGQEQREMLAQNLETVFNKQIPENSKINQEAFAKALSEPEIKSYVGVHSEPLIDAWISFSEESVSVLRPTRVSFRLQNCHDRPLQVRNIGIQTNVADYDISKPLEITLQPGDIHEAHLEITPHPRDAGKIIQLQVGMVDIGNENVIVRLHYSLIHKSLPTLWNDENRGLNVMKIEGSRQVLVCEVKREEPALVGEAHKVTFLWTNTDSAPISRLILTFFLSTTSPQLVRLSPDAKLLSEAGHGGGLSHSVELETLAPSATHETVLYLRVNGESELRFIAKAKYIDSVGQPVGTDCVTPITVITPFALSTNIADTQGESLVSLSPFQIFILTHKLTNVSSTNLKLTSVRFKVANSCFEQKAASAGDDDLVLKHTETVSAMQLLELNEIPPPELTNITSLVLKWCRIGEGSDGALVSTEMGVGLPRLDAGGGLRLTGEFGEGRLKKPMPASYILMNRSSFCFDLSVSIDSTEYFMNAGPKKLNVKLNGKDHIELSYILFPLKAGLVSAPRLLVEGNDPAQPPTIFRDIQKTIFVRRVEEISMDNDVPILPTSETPKI